ncbi:MAG TPA: MFS transporter [Pilimelia sp.]|nr:MFS transporter [Pilimelia sp.]
MMNQLGEASPTRRARSNPRRWLVLPMLGTAFFIAMLDGTIVYTALPQIQRALDFSVSGLQWVMSAYLLSFGGLLLLAGRLADRLGRHRMFALGMALFTAGSLVAGLAWSSGALIGARAVQGIGAAVMAPTTLSLVVAAFGESPDRRRALTVWTAIGAFGGTAGLVIGGLITDNLGWRWIFLLNVPVGVVLLVMSPALPRRTAGPGDRRAFGVVGAVTLTVALVLLVFAVTGAAHAGWASARTVGLVLASAALLALSALVELRAREPVVPLRALARRTLVGGVIVLLTAGMALDGTLFLLTGYLQRVLGYSATTFGVMLTAMTLSSVVGSFAGQILVVRRGFRPVASVGMALIGLGCLLLTAVSAAGSYVGEVFVALLLIGPGLGAAFVAAQIAMVSGFPETESGEAGSLADASFSIGGVLGLAVLSAALVSRTPGAAADQVVSLPALATGISAGFGAAVFIAAAGFAAAVMLLRPHPAREPRQVTTR